AHARSDGEEREHLGGMVACVPLAVRGGTVRMCDGGGDDGGVVAHAALRRDCVRFGVVRLHARSAGGERSQAERGEPRAHAGPAQSTPSGFSPSSRPSGKVIERYWPPFSSLRSG